MDLGRFELPVGVHRKHLKILAFGGPGSGKSTLAAAAPGRVVLLDGGERATGLYMDESRVVRSLDVSQPDVYMAAMEWCIKNAGEIDSVVCDGINHIWDGWMDQWAEKLDREQLQAQDWRQVKGPWKAIHWSAYNAPFNLVYTCHMKDLQYERVKGVTGDATKIKPIELPQIEKSMPYLFDMIVHMRLERDDKEIPTGWHRMTLHKVRRPRGVPADKLHVGLFFRSHEKAPVDPWQQLTEQVLPLWHMGAVDTLGTDPRQEGIEREEMMEAAGAVVCDGLLTLIQGLQTLAEARTAYDREIHPNLSKLTKNQLARVQAAIATKKTELGGK